MSVSFLILIFFAVGVGCITVLAAFFRSGHFFKCFLFSVFTGTGSLLAIHFTSLMTHFAIPITAVTLATSALGGLPGVVALSVLRVFG